MSLQGTPQRPVPPPGLAILYPLFRLPVPRSQARPEAGPRHSGSRACADITRPVVLSHCPPGLLLSARQDAPESQGPPRAALLSPHWPTCGPPSSLSVAASATRATQETSRTEPQAQRRGAGVSPRRPALTAQSGFWGVESPVLRWAQVILRGFVRLEAGRMRQTLEDTRTDPWKWKEVTLDPGKTMS